MGERLLARKRALVVGLMNKHSIASSITQSLLSAGADVVVTSKSPLSERQIQACQFDVSHGSSLHFQACDVEKEEEIEILINNCSTIFDGKLDILVHSIAYAPPDTFKPLLSDDQKLTGGLLSVSKDAWNQAFNTSAYSLIGLTRAAYPLLINGDRTSSKSIVSLSYLGAEKVVPSYNLMGPAKAALEATSRQLAYELGEQNIRVNCVSPGPMNTVSARGIPGISKMRTYAEEHSPLRKKISGKEVGDIVAFLSSEVASSITAQTIYVDGGLSAMAPHA